MSKFCCRANKNKKYNCKARGRKICFYARKKVVTKCKYTVSKSKGIVCKQKMCCGAKGCKKTGNKECAAPQANFCKWTFVRRGKCRRQYCCVKNDKGKFKCGYKHKVICRKIRKGRSLKKRRLAKKYFTLKFRLSELNKSIKRFNIKYWNERQKCQKKLFKSKLVSKKQQKILRRKFFLIKKKIKKNP